MQIIVAGLGKVGSYLAGELSMENHDVTVVDTRNERVRAVTSRYDLMGMTGSIIDPEVISQTGMDEADLFIAVTASDETNLLSCLLARKAGCARTIARVRTREYAANMDYLSQALGIELIINPEELAAQEIERVLNLPGAIDVDVFTKDKGFVYQFRVAKDSVLDGLAVRDVPAKVNNETLICVDERQGKAYIPDGDFVIQGKDILYVAGSRQGTAEFFKKAGIRTQPVKRVMIVGAGKIAHYLVNMLEKEKTETIVIDRNPAACEAFAVLHPKTSVICADAVDQNLLEEEGLEDMDALVSLTGIDEVNVFLSLYASRKDGIKTVTKANRIQIGDILDDLEIDSMINTKTLTAEYIIKQVRAIANSRGSNVETVHRLAHDQVEAVEFQVSPESRLVGVPLYKLPTKTGVLFALIVRNGNPILPRGNDVIQSGDNVVVITNRIGFLDLDDVLAKDWRAQS